MPIQTKREKIPFQGNFVAGAFGVARQVNGEWVARCPGDFSDELGKVVYEYAAIDRAVEAARAAIAGEQEKNAAVLDLLDHFSAAHRPGDPLHRPSKALEWLRHDALVYQDDYFPAREKKLAAAAAALRAAAGQLADGDISTQAADPLFDQWEAAIAANTAKLKGLMKGRRPPEQAKDWPAGQVTMAELTALYEKDAAQNPAHWTARAEAAPAP